MADPGVKPFFLLPEFRQELGNALEGVWRRQGAEIQGAVRLDAVAARQLRGIPAAAQSLDQRDAREQAVLPDVDGRFGISESRGLGDDNIRVGDRPRLVLVEDDALGLARRRNGRLLRAGLVGENAQSRKLVLDLL